jgi:hypothetical protein
MFLLAEEIVNYHKKSTVETINKGARTACQGWVPDARGINAPKAVSIPIFGVKV